MSEAALLQLIQGIQAAIAAAPEFVVLAEEAVAFIDTIFDSGAITADQQRRAKDHIDLVQKAVDSDTVPPEFVVDPDPK